MSASAEHLLISKTLQDGNMDAVIKLGIKPDHLSSGWGDVWRWMLNYFRTYGAVPSARAFANEYPDLELFDARDETFSGLVDEIIAAYKQRLVVETLSDVMPQINLGDTEGAIKTLSIGLQKATVETVRMRDIDIVQNWEARVARYEEMRNTPNSLRGIPTGFYGLDRITFGLRPQQFIVFAGEPKRGKSLFALIIANSAHVHGVRPLFVSFEMSIEEQEARYDALIAKVPYNRILSGDLSKKEIERIRTELSRRKNMQPFVFSEDTASLTTVSALAGKVREYQPDVLIVDGVYLMDDEEGEPKGSPQALTNITRALKRLAQSFDIPVIATTQVLSWKLQNKKTRAVTADAIGYTSSFAQDADLILGVERSPDFDDQAIIRVVLARSAPTGSVHIKWNWETMDFTEVDDTGESLFDDFG